MVMKNLVPLTLLAAGPLLGAAQYDMVPRELQGQPVPATPAWLDPSKQLSIANCVIDIGVATVQLAQAGLGINSAVTRCGNQIGADGKPVYVKTPEAERACAATVVGVTASFQYAAFFMTSAAIDCSKSFTLVDQQAMNYAQCAADTQLLLASLTLIAAAGTGVGDACKDVNEVYVPSVKDVRKGKERKALIAECVFDVGQTVLLFSRAGLFINAAVKDCSAVSLYQGPDKNKAKCAADIENMVGAFAFAAGGIAAAVAHCPEWYQGAKPECAGSILSLIAATAKVQAASTSMAIDCTPAALSSKGASWDPDSARRLGSNASASVPDAQFV